MTEKPYDWEQDAKDSYALAIACKREQHLVATIPGCKRERVIGRCELLEGDCLEIMPGLGIDNRNAVVFNSGHEQSTEWQHRAPKRGDENMGAASSGDCGVVSERAKVSGADGEILRGDACGFSEGNRTNGNTSQIEGQAGGAERALHRRDAEHSLPQDGGENALQQMRGDEPACYSSQGSCSYEQRVGQSGSALQPMPHQPPQTGMVELPKGWAILTDPPYGMSYTGNGGKGWTNYNAKWDATRPIEALKVIDKINCEKIIWGGNYFADLLPPSKGWLYWQKLMGGDFADGELAWTSLDRALREFTKCPKGQGAAHPTQKPIIVMEWCLGFLPNAETILDPFMGSGTTLVACAKLGRRGIGIELDKSYFDIAVKRVEEAYRQPDLFVEPPKPAPTQEGLDI